MVTSANQQPKYIEQIPPIVLGSPCEFYRTFNVPRGADHQKISEEIARQIPSKLEIDNLGAYTRFGGLGYFDGERASGIPGKYRIVLRENYMEIWGTTKEVCDDITKKLFPIVTGNPEPTSTGKSKVQNGN